MPLVSFRKSHYQPYAQGMESLTDNASRSTALALRYGGAAHSDEAARTDIDRAGRDVYLPSRPARNLPEAAQQARAECGNALCQSAWHAPWKSRRRPFFEGGWACSSACLKDMVRNALRREHGDVPMYPAPEHRHRVPLGLVLLAQGWITQPQLRRALDAQRENGTGRIGDWLVESCGIDSAYVTRGLGVQWNCPVFSTAGALPSRMALAMPPALLEQHGILPVRTTTGGVLRLVSAERPNPAIAYALNRMHGLEVECGLAPAVEVNALRGTLLEAEAVACDMVTVQDSEELCNRIAATITHHQPVAARLVRVHQHFWLRCWLEEGSVQNAELPRSAEDIHDLLITRGSRSMMS
jgi:hypothetical protein